MPSLTLPPKTAGTAEVPYDWSDVNWWASEQERCEAHAEAWYEPLAHALTQVRDTGQEFGEAGVIYLQLHNDGLQRTTLYTAGIEDPGDGVTAGLIGLAATILHELLHVCDPTGTPDSVRDGALDESADAKPATYGVEEQYRQLATARYLR